MSSYIGKVATAAVTLAGAFALVVVAPIHNEAVDGFFGIGLGVAWLGIVAVLRDR